MKRPRSLLNRRLQMQSLESRTLLAGDLRIVELNYHPHAPLVQFGERDTEPDDFEFVEVMNVGDAVLNLSGYRIDAGVEFHFAQQFLNPGERLVVTKDLKDFRSRFGDDVSIALGNDGDGGKGGEYAGSLKNAGETVGLSDPTGRTIQSFTYYDAGEWPALADGKGSSLEILDPVGDGNDPKNWRASSEYGGSPGVEGRGFSGEVVINEVLAHTDLPQVDAIELYNRSEHTVDMTGWYLSDSAADIFKYRINGAAAIIARNDYRTFDENTLLFALEGQEAETLYLIEADSIGRPLRFVDAVSFGATQNGVTLGRWANGSGELFPMTELTFDDTNFDPLIGDVVISEVHYHPDDTATSGRLSVDDLEFVELFNRTGVPLDVGQWRLQQAVNFTIPKNTVIEAGGTLLIISFDPDIDPSKTREFLDFYGIDDEVTVLGPYSDAEDPNADLLDDDGETLILDRPEDPLQLGRGYVLVDRVIYRDDGEWPVEADGQGSSLTRAETNGYGDFPGTWIAAIPSPGRTGTPGDVTGDGLTDVEDIDALCTAIRLGSDKLLYDLNDDRVVDIYDHDFLITVILDTHLGDANLDGRFDSNDLVVVFASGGYEDQVSNNSSWAGGDFNCDGEFTSNDLVAAFAEGVYEQANASPRQALFAATQDTAADTTNRSATAPLTDTRVSAPPAKRPVMVEPQNADAVFDASGHDDIHSKDVAIRGLTGDTRDDTL